MKNAKKKKKPVHPGDKISGGVREREEKANSLMSAMGTTGDSSYVYLEGYSGGGGALF